MVVSKPFTTFVYYLIGLLDLVPDCLTQIPEHELQRWPWYSMPGVRLLYEKVLQDWLVNKKTKRGDIQRLLSHTV